jgi:hypothetical protein
VCGLRAYGGRRRQKTPAFPPYEAESLQIGILAEEGLPVKDIGIL